MTPLRFLLLTGCAFALSSCDLFKPGPPAAPTDAYGAAGAYGTTPAANNGGYPANPQGGQYGQQPTGAYGAGNPAAAGGYTQPNYNQPYTQPADTGAGYGAAANPGGGNYGTASGRTHTVANGENLSKISRRYSVSMDALMRANNITDPNFVRAGQKLTIP